MMYERNKNSESIQHENGAAPKKTAKFPPLPIPQWQAWRGTLESLRDLVEEDIEFGFGWHKRDGDWFYVGQDASGFYLYSFFDDPRPAMKQALKGME